MNNKNFKEVIDNVIMIISIAATVFIMWLGCTATADAAERTDGKCIAVVTSKQVIKTGGTGYTIKYNNKEYEIMRGARGGLYIMVNGNKRYLSQLISKKELERIKNVIG